MRRAKKLAPVLAGALLLTLATMAAAATTIRPDDPSPIDTVPLCANTVVARVVALDQPFFWNRLGAVQPQGMIYALERDVEPQSGYTSLQPGHVQLKRYKRPRPLILRVSVGSCLEIHFKNLLFPVKPTDIEHEEQPATRPASVHVVGMQLVGSIASDGSNVGQNASSLVLPGGTAVYTYYAQREGQHVFHSGGSFLGGEGDGGAINSGLFGAVMVEPAGSVWYRSQVTRRDMDLATSGFIGTTGLPILNYAATYPTTDPDRPGLPILNLLQGNEIVHSDLEAIIVPRAGTYKDTVVNTHRDEPFREFAMIFHDEIGAVQAFPQFEDPALEHTLMSVSRRFAINYGTGGIGSEILANRLGVGPVASAPSASSRSSSSPRGRWATRRWWWTCRPTRRARFRTSSDGGPCGRRRVRRRRRRSSRTTRRTSTTATWATT